MTDELRDHHPQPGDDVTGSRPSDGAPDGSPAETGATAATETRAQRRNRKRREANASKPKAAG